MKVIKKKGSHYTYVIYFTDKPEAPGQPQIDQIYAQSADINWAPPPSDGGSPITNYVVEYRKVGDMKWQVCGTVQWNLYYPTLYYTNFQLSDLQSTLPTPFKPVILGLLLSDLSIIRPYCYCPKRVG